MCYAYIFLYKILAPKIKKLCDGFGIFLRQKFCTKNALVKRWWNCLKDAIISRPTSPKRIILNGNTPLFVVGPFNFTSNSNYIHRFKCLKFKVEFHAGVNFINVFCAFFSYERRFGSFSLVMYMCVVKAAKKIRT
jgi:hypothetical protein